MQKRIWSKYNRELVQRGSVTFLIDPKVVNSIKNYKPKSSGGRPMKFPPQLVELLLAVKIQFSLAYRALEGFAKSVFENIKRWFEVPTYSTICKRAKELSLALPKLSSKRPKIILLDSSGIKIFGEGEWKRKIHGVGRPRQWLKMHIAVDEATQEVIAEELSDCRVSDGSMVENLLDHCPDTVELVKADGAYDGKRIREAVTRRGAVPLVPPPRNARLRRDGSQRDLSLMQIVGLGGDKLGRSLWGRLSGYSRRVLVETAFSRYKRIFGNRLFSQTFERQRVENRIKWVILNKMMNVS